VDPDPDPQDQYVFGPPGSADPDLLVRASEVRILLSFSKNSEKNLDSYCFVTSL
jgi:hypothetical protein